MRDIPECMNRRYQALDELIAELTTLMSDQGQGSLQKCGSESNDASVKLMCEFWNILKEDPDCNLTEVVQQRMGLDPKSSRSFRPQRLACYMASKDNCCKDNKNVKKPEPVPKGGCCSSKSVSASSTSEMLPLSKVLCNLKEAVSFDKKCNLRISELMATQQQLQDQIQQLEERERAGTQMLKQADCMWSCMEDAYKKKVAETLQRQNVLLKQIKEIETSNTKWRKNKKELEFQLGNVNKCYEEIKLKLQEKAADVKCIKMEVETFTKRAEANKKETAAVKKSFTNKKTASSARIASMSAEITRIKQKVYEEQTHKREKELEGSQHVKEAREDLQKIYRVLLQKKLENEDLRAEKEAIIQEIDLLRKTCDLCKDKCRIKHETLIDEVTKVDAEIAGYKARCIKCHECTDTGDTRKCCIDCPRCADTRECLYEDGRCITDVTMDCVCMSTKQKFIDNVFDNMYTVLERQAKTPPGKAVADAVLECLKRSRNGKLNDETKKILQDFVLTTVKKNLNLTIIGGAVKTRCEMDPETYQQLMLCLKQVKPTPPPKADKATVPKKDPCSRWGGTSECNCPKGPKSCVCGKRAPPPPNEPDTCPPSQDKDDVGKVLVCPHNKESAACGADCAMHAVPSAVGTDVAAWRPAPCSEKHCSFSKNMRAAQCFLGPDSLTSASKTKSHKSNLRYIPDMSVLKNQIICKCGPTPTNPCECRKDTKYLNTDVEQCDKSSCTTILKQDKQGFKNKAEKTTNGVELEKLSPKTLEKENITTKTSRNLEGNHIMEIVENHPENFLKTSQKSEESKRSSSPDNNSMSFNAKDLTHDGDTFKVSIYNENGHLNNQYTKLATSSSGALIMELDEEIITQIEQKMNKYPNVSVSLNKTASGHCILDFSSTKEHLNKMFDVKKSPSGNLLFEVDTDTVEDLKTTTDKKYSLDSKPSTSIAVSPKNEHDMTKHDIFKSNCSVSSDISSSQRHVYCPDTREPNDKKNSDTDKNTVVLQFEEENGQFTESEAFLTTSDSGKTSLVFNSISRGVAEMLVNRQHHPILLTQSSSKTYLLDIKSSKTNALIIKTASGKFIITVFDKLSMLKTANNSKETEAFLSDVPGYFRFNIKDSTHNISYFPAVLKETNSNNYIIVVDKEYVKQYKETLNKTFDNDFEYPIVLSKTLSGSIEVEFIKSGGSTVIPNALLTISKSGNIKLLADNKTHSIPSNSRSYTTDVKPRIEIFSKMLSQLPEAKIDLKTASNITDKKSSSDSKLYEKVNMQLQNQQSLLNEPSAMLRQTSSGQYAIVLNKESKIAFINNLKSYLSSNSQGLVPIKRTEQGEITITLNNDKDTKNQYGSLKITPSGNIFVLVDEKYIQEMTKNTESEKPVIITDAKTVINDTKEIKDIENKCVTTTCNALPDNSCDDTKCVCSEIIQHGVSESNVDRHSVKCETSFRFCFEENDQDNCRKPKCQYKTSDQYLESEDNLSVLEDKSPHIVIKPCSCHPNSHKGSMGSDQQLLYVAESICPFHKDRYESVSNELLEISGLCKAHKNHKGNRNNKNITQTYNNNHITSNVNFMHFQQISSDYLDYLPPQLPPFLRNFKCA